MPFGCMFSYRSHHTLCYISAGTTVIQDGDTRCAEDVPNVQNGSTGTACWADCLHTYASGNTSVVGVAAAPSAPLLFTGVGGVDDDAGVEPSATGAGGSEGGPVGVKAGAGERPSGSAVAIFDFVTPPSWNSRLRYRKSYHYVDGRMVAVVSGIKPIHASFLCCC
jgi:hypothetical protein